MDIVNNIEHQKISPPKKKPAKEKHPAGSKNQDLEGSGDSQYLQGKRLPAVFKQQAKKAE